MIKLLGLIFFTKFILAGDVLHEFDEIELNKPRSLKRKNSQELQCNGKSCKKNSGKKKEVEKEFKQENKMEEEVIELIEVNNIIKLIKDLDI